MYYHLTTFCALEVPFLDLIFEFDQQALGLVMPNTFSRTCVQPCGGKRDRERQRNVTNAAVSCSLPSHWEDLRSAVTSSATSSRSLVLNDFAAVWLETASLIENVIKA